MNNAHNDKTTIAAWVIVISKTLDDLGFDANNVLLSLNLDRKSIEQNPSQRIAITTMTKLWRKITHLTNRADIGFLVAQRMQPQYFKGLGFALLASETLRDCFERITTYSDSISNSVDVTIESGIKESALCIQPKANTDISAEAIDAFMSVLHQLFKQVLSVRHIQAKLDFCCDSRGIAATYQTQFSTQVSFNQEKNRYWLSNVDLDKKLILGDKELASQNDSLVATYLAQINNKHDNWLTIINAEIVKGIFHSNLSAVVIAKKVNISERSLRRKLSAQGTSFNTLVEHNKKTLAKQWLADHGKSITDISFLLGYTDTSNFTRAFKKWFGITPSQYKIQNQ